MSDEKKTTAERKKPSTLEELLVGVPFTAILLAAFVCPLVVGCGQQPQKAEGEKAGQKNEAPKEAPPAATVRDPRADSAKKISEVLAGHRKDINSDIDRVNKTHEIVRGETKLADIEIVKRLQANAAIAIRALNELNEELLRLDRELKHAQNAFTAYAQAFRDRSEDYTDASLKNNCLEWAKYYDGLAATIPDERKRIAAFVKEIPPTLVMARESKQLLDDLNLFISTYHDGTVPTAEVEKYQSTLKGYVAKFSAFENSAKAYQGK